MRAGNSAEGAKAPSAKVGVGLAHLSRQGAGYQIRFPPCTECSSSASNDSRNGGLCVSGVSINRRTELQTWSGRQAFLKQLQRFPKLLSRVPHDIRCCCTLAFVLMPSLKREVEWIRAVDGSTLQLDEARNGSQARLHSPHATLDQLLATSIGKISPCKGNRQHAATQRSFARCRCRRVPSPQSALRQMQFLDRHVVSVWAQLPAERNRQTQAVFFKSFNQSSCGVGLKRSHSMFCTFCKVPLHNASQRQA